MIFFSVFAVLLIINSTLPVIQGKSINELQVKDWLNNPTKLYEGLIYNYIYRSTNPFNTYGILLGPKLHNPLNAIWKDVILSRNKFAANGNTYIMTDLNDDTTQVIAIEGCDECQAESYSLCGPFTCKSVGKDVNIIKRSSLFKVEFSKYRINSFVHDFRFEVIPESIVRNHTQSFDLIQKTVFKNDSPATIKEIVSIEKTMKESFEVVFERETMKSMEEFKQTSIEMRYSAGFWGFGVQRKTTNTESVRTVQTDRVSESTKFMNSTERKYTINREVYVPPFSAVLAQSTFQWIDNIKTPFSAKMTLSGKCPLNIGCDDLTGDQMKALLFDSGFKGIVIEQSLNTITYEVYGDVTGSYGMEAEFNLRQIHERPRLEPVKTTVQTPVQTSGTNSAWIWILIAIIVLFFVLVLAIIFNKRIKNIISNNNLGNALAIFKISENI